MDKNKNGNKINWKQSENLYLLSHRLNGEGDSD